MVLASPKRTIRQARHHQSVLLMVPIGSAGTSVMYGKGVGNNVW